MAGEIFSENQSAFKHEAGSKLECLSQAFELHKDKVIDPSTGAETLRAGFKIGGGIDQDHTKSPHGYSDTGIYITAVEPNSTAEKVGLLQHDKILQVNGYDFTMVTHEKAVKYIKKYPVLYMLVARKQNS